MNRETAKAHWMGKHHWCPGCKQFVRRGVSHQYFNLSMFQVEWCPQIPIGPPIRARLGRPIKA